MWRKSFMTLCISLIALAWFGLQSVSAADLPASNWYAVVRTLLGDQLVWINAQGVQATINRPHLPNEMQGPNGSHDVRISPDGRFGVFTATLNDNRTGLGFYDFQKGSFLQIHTSQPNETISLGSTNSFLSDMSGVAIAFYTLGEGVSDWRIIEFDPKTGNVLTLLQKSDNAVPALAIGLGSYPSVFYAQDGLGYRFQMIPYAVGGSLDYDAFTWNPTADTVTADGMITTELDILPTTNTIIESGYEVGLPSASVDGPLPVLNVLTQRNSFDVAPQSLLHDANAYLYSPRWARNGAWYAYNAIMPNNVNYWVVHSTIGAESHAYSDLTPSEIFGTSEGMFLNYDGQTFIASTEMDDVNQPVIYEAPANDQAVVVYVTPQGSFFTLPSVADGLLGEPPQQPSATVSATCEGAPQSQVATGMPVRVTFTDGSTLRVRQEPNGTIITELAEGTEFSLIDGPVCANGLIWWKMSMLIQGGTLEGWVAEGSGTTYFIEPWYQDGPDPLPTLPPAVQITLPPAVVITLPPAVAITSTPMVLINPPLLATKPILINPVFVVDNDCSFAVPAYFAVGNTVATIDKGLAVYSSPTATTPDANLEANVSGSVTGGPSCHKGFRKWKVSFSNGVSGWVADSYGGNVYLKKQ